MTAYADLASLPENDRIRIMGELAEQGQLIAFFVDSDHAADRYVSKLTERYRVRVVSRMSGPVKGTIAVTVTRKLDS